MAIELAQRGVLRGRLRFPRGFALELFGVLPGADLPAGLRRGRELTLLGLGQPGHGVKLGARIERRAG